MNIIKIIGISLCVLLSQCTSVSKKKAFKPVKNELRDRIAITPEWRTQCDMGIKPCIENQNVTVEDTIAIGLKYNPELQAAFEDLGIVQADLMQAGFYSNPNISSIFRIPKKDVIQTNIEITANFMLSDLWQVPFRKKVAEGNLEIKSLMIGAERMESRDVVRLENIY